MSLDRETELLLSLNRDARCINPWCDEPARVVGEFCASCTAAQQRTREALRRHAAQRANDAV